MEFKQLPDYPVFKKLADALWQPANAPGGAAVMVGSGFSRCAAENADPNLKMPLWSDFTERVKSELGMEAASNMDPLKIAEEYRVHFSQNALNGLIEQVVNNSAWQPGEMYRELLKFSWREVLTTNWDTLLERATKQYQSQHFQVVRKPSDLTHTVAPRITKLHGTIGFSEKYIVTEEDYRTYPQQFGIFVNFVRQVLIENALCLIGFSGDDPNFLQWLGWIRDNLQERAHNIYLVGMLNLSPSKRRYFESLNISPIDLEPLVSDISDTDTQHKLALELFFDALEGEEPDKVWEWQTYSGRVLKQYGEMLSFEDDSHKSPKVKNTKSEGILPSLDEFSFDEKLAVLKADRQRYPNWIIPPSSLDFDLLEQVSIRWVNPQTFATLSAERRVQFLIEIVWCYEQSRDVCPGWLLDELQNLLSTKSADLPQPVAKDVALCILRHEYYYDSKSDQLKPFFNQVREHLGGLEELYPEIALELLYHDAIFLRDEFEFTKLEDQLAKMEAHPVANNAIWGMRRAALYAELGKFDKCKELTSRALSELSSSVKDQPDSMYLLSLWSWCRFAAHLYSDEFESPIFVEPESVKQRLCDAEQHLRMIERRTDDLKKRHMEQLYPIEPGFGSGKAKDHRNKKTGSNEVVPFVLLERLTLTVGLPLSIGGTSVIAQSAASFVIYCENLDNLSEERYFILAIRSAIDSSDEIINKQFSRLALARTKSEIIVNLYIKTLKLLDYWLPEYPKNNPFNLSKLDYPSFVIARIKVLLQVLARMSVRLSVEQNKKLFLKGIGLAQQDTYRTLLNEKDYDDLLSNTLQAIPESHYKDLLLPTLKFPLSNTNFEFRFKKWSNPVINHVEGMDITPEIKVELGRLIDLLDASSKHRNIAILERLLPFCEAGVLDEETKAALVSKLWDNGSEINVAIETNFLANGLLRLACPDPEQYRRRITGRLFAAEKLEPEPANTNLFGYITIFAKDEYHPILPTSEQAQYQFSKIVKWAPEQPEDSGTSLFLNPRKQLEELAKQMALAMSFAFVPCLPQAAFTEENYNLLMDFKLQLKQQKLAHTALLPALAEFAVRLSVYREPVAKEIKYAMAIERNGFANAAEAVLSWLDKSPSKKLHPKVSELRDLLVAGVSPVSNTANLKLALWGCVKLEEKGNLSSHNIEYLVDVLPVLFDAYDYHNFNPYTEEAVAPPVVKKWLVKLARRLLTRLAAESEEECDLSALNDLIDTAKHDALPEVRFEAMEG